MRFTTLIARTGVPLPPPAGPARIEHCLREGALALRAATALRAKAELRLGPILVGGLRALPAPQALLSRADGSLAAEHARNQIRPWFMQAASLGKRAEPSWLPWTARLRGELVEIETDARAALGYAVDAYNWLDDAAQDRRPDLTLVLTDRGDALLADLLEHAHAQVHAVGALVGGLFGCYVEHRDGGWFEQCRTDLMHLRRGLSPGFTARHVCSVCDEDLSACPHLRGKSYTAPVRRDSSGRCSVCARRDCDHVIGELTTTVCASTLRDIKLLEVSFVSRPRDPLARITSREVDASKLAKMLGAAPDPDLRLLDHGCMQPCQGFRAADEDA